MEIDESDIQEAANASEDIAERLGWLCDATNEMLDCGLTEDAIIALIKEKSGNRVTKDQIKHVIRTLPKLREFLAKQAA